MIPALLGEALSYMFNLQWEIALRMFWLFFLFDFPRYVLTDIYIFFYEIINKFRPRRWEKSFLLEMLERPPLVSVIVPVLNEQDTIEWTVRSLKEQTYKNLQIIIIDDGSTDNTPQICSRLKELEGISYFRFAERAGKSAALNYGLRLATGKYIVFVDSDTTFDRDAIFNLIKAFADPKVGAVSGNLRPRNAKKNLLTILQHIEYLFSISVGRRIRAHFGILPVVSGAFGGFRKEIISLYTIGGHEPGPGNDSDLTIRIRKLGYKIAFAPEANAMCLTNVPETFSGLIRQRWRWDRNLIKNRLRKHKDVYNPFSKNFKLKDIASFVDTIFFHIILALISLTYLIDISLHYSQLLPLLLAINLILYFFAELIELLIVVLLSQRWEDLYLVIYLPLFHPYKLILKFFRIIGYFQEIFFHSSYRDPFAPFKVRQRMIRW
jgi:cellulose synthase/poly-beta-1,6-N-acetylglucosamine synthase-like glycosyltransferase